MLFHITTRAAWERARSTGVYHPESLDREGFIHLSTAAQWRRTLARFYADQPGLVLLVIDPARAGDIRYERADDDDFPHLYNPLPMTAVTEVRELESPGI